MLAEWGLPQLPKRSRLRGMMTTPCRKGLNPWVELLPEPPLPGNFCQLPPNEEILTLSCRAEETR